jgi:hypothetical protein
MVDPVDGRNATRHGADDEADQDDGERGTLTSLQ